MSVMYGFEKKPKSSHRPDKFASIVGVLKGKNETQDDEFQLEEGDNNENWIFKYLKPDNKICWWRRDKHNQDRILILYLNWSFNTSFLHYMISAVAGFVLCLLVFAAVIYVYAKYSTNQCISRQETSNDTLFAHAFGLSWTTFSTVGYGHTYPTLSDECAFLTLISVIESFVGVLYAGFCGAILFGKVTRVYAHAKVEFSDFFVIRYGRGVDIEEDDDDYEKPEETDQPDGGSPSNLKRNVSSQSHPFPMLVFRVANEFANNENYGGIMHMSISATATRLETKRVIKDSALPKMRFFDLNIEPSTIPMFRKVAYVRHKLDASSPLLTSEAKKLIADNYGRWPTHLSEDAEKIRELIKFQEMFIIVEGTSEISYLSVSANKVYSCSQGKIGYQFLGMTFQNNDEQKTTTVKFDLLNDLVEQNGGGGQKL